MKAYVIAVLWVGIVIPAHAAPLSVVAAENFYADVAHQIGGDEISVTGILTNPNQDPHLFEASPSVARAVSRARLVVYNGIDYDPWMGKLLGASRHANRVVIDVAALAGRKPGDNPHIWYDTEIVSTFAAKLTDELCGMDAPQCGTFRRRLLQFRQSLQPVRDKIAALRRRLGGTPVTATEPVFGYMLAALGMNVRNERFQLAVMNGTEPSAAEVAAFEGDLKQRRVKLLLYNRQASDPIAERMVMLARASQIPVVAVTETEPAGKNYQAWLASELDAVARALP
jgi:zinc/manganese transport system substrate-binding protein